VPQGADRNVVEGGAGVRAAATFPLSDHILTLAEQSRCPAVQVGNQAGMVANARTCRGAEERA